MGAMLYGLLFPDFGFMIREELRRNALKSSGVIRMRFDHDVEQKIFDSFDFTAFDSGWLDCSINRGVQKFSKKCALKNH